MKITDHDQRWMAKTRVMTPEEFEQMLAAMRDPEYVARLAADVKAMGMVEVDNPMRREVRPRRGAEVRTAPAECDNCDSTTDVDPASGLCPTCLWTTEEPK